MVRQEEMSVYVLQTFLGYEELKKRYPNIQIISITPGVFRIEIPKGDTETFRQLQKEVGEIRIPILLGLNALEALQVSNISPFHDYPFGELRGTGVLIGMVDTGIDYTNTLFQYEDNTTRIVSIWDQTIPANPPSAYDYGSEYTEDQINEALKSPDPYSVVPSRDEIGHGTFLAGVAAGNDRSSSARYTGAAPDAMLVVVKLRQASDTEKASFFLSPETVAYNDIDIMAGINYLILQAIKFNKPLVILIGLGCNFGNHGGDSILERFLEALTLYPRIIVCIAAGNEANAAHHYLGKIAGGESKNIEVNVAAGESGVVLQLWTTEADKVSVGITTPIGQVVERVPLRPNETEEFTFTLQQSKVTVTYNYPEIATGTQFTVIALQNPIPGLWGISVYGDFIIDGTFNMWLPRVGFINTNTRFTEPNSSITLSIPATGSNTIVVGAYDYVDGSVFASSSRGPTTDGVIKPDIIAPGVNVEGPSLNGGYTVYVGTSTAAAITAGACALLLQWGIVQGNVPNMNTRIARIMLCRGANRRKGIDYPNNTEGYGKLDLRKTLELF